MDAGRAPPRTPSAPPINAELAPPPAEWAPRVRDHCRNKLGMSLNEAEEFIRDVSVVWKEYLKEAGSKAVMTPRIEGESAPGLLGAALGGPDNVRYAYNAADLPCPKWWRDKYHKVVRPDRIPVC